MKALTVLSLALVLTAACGSSAQAAGRAFRRGQIIGNGRIQIGDAVRILSDLFQGASFITCEDAADANDDGQVDIADPEYLLGHLFVGGRPPPEPFDSCGVDPTDDLLGCNSDSGCPPCGELCAPGAGCIPLDSDNVGCASELATCEDVQAAYAFVTRELAHPCRIGRQCVILFGHCGIGLGGCYHVVSHLADTDWIITAGEQCVLPN